METISRTELVKQYSKQLNLSCLSKEFDQVILQAEKNKISYVELAKNLLEKEIDYRKQKDRERRIKLASLPLNYDLNLYDYSLDNGIEKQQMNQLRELGWLEQNFNIILMGPSGTAKTYIASGLCFDAVERGYRAYFMTMDQLVNMLKMKDVTRKAASLYKRVLKAHLLVIDDVMMFPVNQQEATAFFYLINQLHEKASVIITTNKSPKQWAEVIKDEVLVTALLDRLLFRCEILKLTGKGYRMKNRKTIFNKAFA